MSDNNKFKQSYMTALKTAGTIIGTTAVFDAATAAIIPVAGFTVEGVAAGSLAAGIQSTIGAVKAGSSFAHLQSLGALGQGILGVSGLPVVVGVVATGAVVYIVFENKQEIGDFMKQNKDKLEEQLKIFDQKLKLTQKVSREIKYLSEGSNELVEKAKQLAIKMPQIIKRLAIPKPKL